MKYAKMSLEDLNTFHNGNDGGIINYEKSGEEIDNIFEEIEQLLKDNEGLDIPKEASNMPPSKSQNNLSKPSNEADTINLDFLPACDNQAFLINSDTQPLPEEELSLYSVNQNELHPVNAPFMVPGIYKKIANTPITPRDAAARGAVSEATNVFLTTKRARGKIISRDLYENCATAEQTNEQENLQENNAGEARCSGVESAYTGALLKFASGVYESAPNDQLEIDRAKNEMLRTCATGNSKIIYRLLGPEDFNLYVNLTSPIEESTKPLKLKKGRPRKQPLNDSDQKVLPILPKKSKGEQNTKAPHPADVFNKPLIRTRSGRIVKTLTSQINIPTIDETPAVEMQSTKDLITDLKDKDFYSSHLNKSRLVEEDSSSGAISKRRVPPESICPKCGKIFLGRRLKRHFTQHPDHMVTGIVQSSTAEDSQPQQQAGIENTTEEITLFRFLMSKLQKPLLNEDQRADLFLNELNDLIEQLQLRSTRLIRNTSGMHFVTARIARVLGIPEGQYGLDMSAIESEMPFMDSTEQHILNGDELKRQRIMPVSVSTPSLDYTAISLDNTLTDEAAQKLNLSAGGKLLPPSEESLLRGVDDLVHDGITKLVDANLLQPPGGAVQSSVASSLVSSHYDHVSDNAVEALSIKENNNAPQKGTALLDLSVDFFKFKNN